MNELSPETRKYYDGLISTYTENLRISDYKSSTILFLLAISISTVAALRNELPDFIPLSLLLLLPLLAIISFLLSIYPRFSATPGYPFFFKRSVGPDDFGTPPESDEEQLILLRNRCVSLAKILYSKVFYFRLALGICLLYLGLLLVLAVGDALHGFPIGRSS